MEESRYANLIKKQTEFLAEFQPFLEKFLKDKESEYQTFLPEAKAIFQSFSSVALSGGKRLRPFLVWLGHQLAGGKGDKNDILIAGLAFEILHTCAIIHNDILDESTLRRGKATLNTALGLEATNKLKEDQEKIGAHKAMLIGDLGFILAAEQIAKISQAKTRELLLQTAEEIITGQYMEYEMEGLVSASAEYLERVRLIKSGLSTLTRPLQVGALLSGATDEELGQIAILGASLGHLFQLRDDWLGLYGDVKKTGKPAGDDVRQGKLTSVALFMLQKAAVEAKDNFLRVWGIRQTADVQIKEVVELTKSSGAAEELEQKIAEKVTEATKILGEKIFTEEQQVLVELVQYLAEREA